MLKQLYIKNIALVNEATLNFDRGLSVLTGETGAGKSVIVTALALILGERADKDYIRHGCSEAEVQAVFDLEGMPSRFKTQFEDFIIDGQFSIKRELTLDGSSRVKINDSQVTLARLREISSEIAEIIGQHSNQMLMDENNHLLFLDYFASIGGLRETVGKLYHQWEMVQSGLRQILNRKDQMSKERELLLFQIDEIEKAQVRVGEEEELITEKKRLDSARSLMESANIVRNLLENDNVSILSSLRQAIRELEKMKDFDDSLEKLAGDFTEIDYQLEELRRQVEKYGSELVDDPQRLEEVNERLDELYLLKKKYGDSEEAILAYQKRMSKQLDDNPDIDSLIHQLQEENKQLREEYTKQALTLTEARHKAADYLAKLVVKELAELAIDAGGFSFQFSYKKDAEGIPYRGQNVRAYEHGLENGWFMFSANPGEPLKPLVKIASGGEVSRVLLALKAAELKNNKTLHPLLIFDEVDVGIGGQTAAEVARKLKKLADSNQLIVITHLHQIARQADHHFAVEKVSEQNRSVIVVNKLDEAGVSGELERMVALPEEA